MFNREDEPAENVIFKYLAGKPLTGLQNELSITDNVSYIIDSNRFLQRTYSLKNITTWYGFEICSVFAQ